MQLQLHNQVYYPSNSTEIFTVCKNPRDMAKLPYCIYVDDFPIPVAVNGSVYKDTGRPALFLATTENHALLTALYQEYFDEPKTVRQRTTELLKVQPYVLCKDSLGKVHLLDSMNSFDNLLRPTLVDFSTGNPL